MKTKYINRKYREIGVTTKHKFCKFSQEIDRLLNYLIPGKFISNSFLFEKIPAGYSEFRSTSYHGLKFVILKQFLSGIQFENSLIQLKIPNFFGSSS